MIGTCRELCTATNSGQLDTHVKRSFFHGRNIYRCHFVDVLFCGLRQDFAREMCSGIVGKRVWGKGAQGNVSNRRFKSVGTISHECEDKPWRIMSLGYVSSLPHLQKQRSDVHDVTAAGWTISYYFTKLCADLLPFYMWPSAWVGGGAVKSIINSTFIGTAVRQ